MKAKVELRRGCIEVKPLRLRVFFPSVEAVVALKAWGAGANFLPARGRRPPARAFAICSRSPGSARPGRLRGGRCRAPRPGAEPPPGLRRGSGSRRLQRNREAGGGRGALRCVARLGGLRFGPLCPGAAFLPRSNVLFPRMHGLWLLRGIFESRSSNEHASTLGIAGEPLFQISLLALEPLSGHCCRYAWFSFPLRRRCENQFRYCR